MIFLTVGMQKFQFDRLLKYVDEKIESGEIQEEVFAQIGNTNYKPKNYRFENFLEKDKFDEKVQDANLVIAHAGVGTISSALKHDKKIIVVPRLEEYGEHINNHQKQIAEMFSKMKIVVSSGESIENLLSSIELARKIRLKKYKFSNQKMQEIIEEYIEENENNKKSKL